MGLRAHISWLMIIITFGLLLQPAVQAEVLCFRSKIKANGKIKNSKKLVSGPKCPKGFLALINTNTLVGPAGADGSLRIYGDSSSQSVTYSENATLPPGTMQYYDFTVKSGVTLTVPSGAVIRCYGTFTNLGTINVEFGAQGGFTASDEIPVHGFERQAHPGVSSGSAGYPECLDATPPQGAHGGVGGVGISRAAAALLRYPGSNAGGGAGHYGRGGGSLVVLARAGIHNGGAIIAEGESHYSGGGGGIIILASPASVVNKGTINAKGADGAPAGDEPEWSVGAGGGGGGGIIHLLSPSIEAGSYSVAGGNKGAGNSSDPGNKYCSGGGGGATGGSGGDGGDVISVHYPANNGLAGYFITSTVDPTGLF